MKENQLIMTVGLPYSGKSTVAKSFNCPIVAPDEIRRALHGGRYTQSAEPMVWAIAKIMVRALFLAGHDKVVLDATNTTKARRDEWKDHAWMRTYVICDVAKIACIDRAIKNDDKQIVPVIERMAEQLEVEGILYGSSGSVDYELPLMEDHIKTPSATDDDPQLFHRGSAKDDI